MKIKNVARPAEPEHPCGDYPAPCNCDDPVNHGGRDR